MKLIPGTKYRCKNNNQIYTLCIPTYGYFVLIHKKFGNDKKYCGFYIGELTPRMKAIAQFSIDCMIFLSDEMEHLLKREFIKIEDKP